MYGGHKAMQTGNTTVIVGYIMTMSVVRLHSVQRWDDKKNDKLEMIWKEAVMA
jgi:hypothetical protein